ncbi:MAG: isoprenyl transferase [Marinilabiliales bacterium]|nr:MAG: isoprenyl transferase [Marinilabiliales bacterium]
MIQAEEISKNKVPVHVAIIMDGNGRWAKAKGLDRAEGHRYGAEAVKKVVRAAGKIGVEYLTLYAFSSENWKRPQYEVDAIMDLLVFMIQRETPELMQNNVRLQAIGEIDRLRPEARKKLEDTIQTTSENTGLNLILALSYSSKKEILRAVKSVAVKVKNGEIKPEDIDESYVDGSLYTADMPDPDLLIRTSGELRISNFLLWQIAYSEFYFTKTYWPDFDEQAFYEAIQDYQARERRFGLTGEQITSNSNPTE